MGLAVIATVHAAFRGVDLQANTRAASLQHREGHPHSLRLALEDDLIRVRSVRCVRVVCVEVLQDRLNFPPIASLRNAYLCKRYALVGWRFFCVCAFGCFLRWFLIASACLTIMSLCTTLVGSHKC